MKLNKLENTLMDIFLIVNLIFFLLVSLICFIIPGVFFIEKSHVQLSFWEKIILGTTVGFTFFCLLSYLLLVIKLHILLLPIIFLINLLALKQTLKLPHQITLLPKNKLILIVLIFSLGVIGQMLVIAPSGIYLNGDLIFWSSHGHDGLWHLSLMEEYNKGYPLQNPSFAGEKLVNYHFFSDIASADFNHYFKLSALDLYFRFFPLIFSILLGSLSFLLGKKLGGFSAGVWAVIFTYFTGSFGYLVTYLQGRGIGGESLFWASQVQSSIGNPPQIVAFVIVLAFLYLFNAFVNNQNRILFLICVLLAGSLAVFKIYGAVVVLLSLAVVGFWQLIKERKIQNLLLFLLSSLLSAILYLPNSSNTGSFLILEPWWFIRTMVVAPDRLSLLDWELRRQTYLSEGNYKRVIFLESISFLIFFFGNLGMRFLGLFSFFGILKTFFSNYLHMVIIMIISISLLLPLLFLQKGVASNTIQFLQYFLLLSGILAALTVSRIQHKIKSKFLNILLIIFIIILSLPTQLALIHSFYNRLPFTKIDKQELIALNFLKENSEKDAVILTPPYNKYFQTGDPIPQIWDWSDTSYVAALASRRTYLADTEQVDIMGYNLKNRLQMQQKIFTETDPKQFLEEIKNQKVNYLYFPKALKPQIDLTKTSLQPFFSNNLIEIWEVY